MSLDGDDSNPGVITNPLQYVQKAVELLKLGNVCTIRYSEEVVISGLQGSPGNPITFRGYPGECVIFDGTVPVTNE